MATFNIDPTNGSDNNSGENAVISAAVSISAVTASNDQITTSSSHGLTSGDEVVITGNTGTTPDINGANQAITVVDATNFTIDGVDITVDGNADGTVQEENGPFVTLTKYTRLTVRSAGDIAICRNGLADNLGAADLIFDEDGTVDNPIIIEADYANAFGDDVDLSATATATLVFGSKAVLFSAAITGVIDAGDVIYAASDAAKDFSYEVALVQASDSGTDDGADSNKLIDTGKFGSTVLGTQVVNTTDSITGYVSELVGANEVEVTLDGRLSGKGGTIVVFDNGDSWTIADQAVLYLPYKGDQAGSGKTMTNIQSPPLWNTPAGNFRWNMDEDHYWKVQGLHLRGTNPAAVVELDAASGLVFKDVIFEGNGASDYGVKVTDDQPTVYFSKCRFFNYKVGLGVNLNTGAVFAVLRDCLLDGNSAPSSRGIELFPWVQMQFHECEFTGHTFADIDTGTKVGVGQVWVRNCIMDALSANQFGGHTTLNGKFPLGYFEDFDRVIGDTRQLTSLSSANGVPIVQSETTTVRSGGSNKSIKVTPSTNLSVAWEHSRQLLFEIPFYATTSSKKYEVFFRPDATANWTADPVAAELWIELEYWGHATNNFRRIVKSAGVIDMNGSTAWTALDVTVAPSQVGVVYLRGYYAKTKESGKTNVFFCDPLPVVT